VAISSRDELVYVATEDNSELAGAVIAPPEGSAPVGAIVWIHGNAASFYDRPYVLVARELAALGIVVVLGNTRGHDIAATLWKADDHSPMAGGGGSGWERMEDAPRDVAPWVALAASRQSGAIVVAGHSKGAQKALLYASGQPSERLSGIALVSPDLRGFRMPGELEIARAMVADGHGMEVLPAHLWAPWYRQSAQAVVSHAEVAERLLAEAAGTPVLAAVEVPVLATFGGLERSAEADLAAIKNAASSATFVETATIAEANHFYDGREAALARIIAQWVSTL
jgi:hypothetical protein